MWWYPAEFFLLTQGATPPTDIPQTETLTVSEAVTAITLAAVPTESLTLPTETRTATVAVVAADSLAVSEVAFGALTSTNQVATDNAAVNDAAAVTAAAVQVDSAAVTETVGAIPITLVASDTPSVTETRTATVAVVATDSLAVSESIGTTTTTGANISSSDTIVLSESIVATLVASALESAAISDTVVPVGILATLDMLTLTDVGSILAPFVGFATAFPSLQVRVRLTGNAGAASVTMDSTLITLDSTLTTLDGGYLGVVPVSLGFGERVDVDHASVDERLAGLVAVS